MTKAIKIAKFTFFLMSVAACAVEPEALDQPTEFPPPGDIDPPPAMPGTALNCDELIDGTVNLAFTEWVSEVHGYPYGAVIYAPNGNEVTALDISTPQISGAGDAVCQQAVDKGLSFILGAGKIIVDFAQLAPQIVEPTSGPIDCHCRYENRVYRTFWSADSNTVSCNSEGNTVCKTGAVYREPPEDATRWLVQISQNLPATAECDLTRNRIAGRYLADCHIADPTCTGLICPSIDASQFYDDEQEGADALGQVCQEVCESYYAAAGMGVTQ